MNSPIFSIVVPVYKVEDYMRQCVDSLLAQDFDSFEIILVDDGSPDGCPGICDGYARTDSRVKVIHQANGGLSEARNSGIRAASGEYVTFVDSDDFWRGTDVLSGVREIISRYSPDIIVSDFIKYYTDADFYLEPIPSDSRYNGGNKQDTLSYFYYDLGDLKISACQKFVRRDLLLSHTFTKGLLSEDIDWSLGLYPDVSTLCIYDKPFYCYRQARKGSISNTAAEKSFHCLMTIIDKWEKRIPALYVRDNEKEIYLGYLAYQLSIAMTIFPNLSKDSRGEALKEMRRHIHLFHHPLNFKTRRVKNLIQLLGIKGSCHALRLFITVRRLLKKG